MKTVDELEVGDYIAFPFNYMSGEPKEIMVSNISFKHEDGFITHFLYGRHSLSEYIPKSDILAIGNVKSGKTKIRGWGGKFDLVQPEHQLIIDNQKEIAD